MNKRYSLAALVLLTSLTSMPYARAQGAPTAAAAAARRQKLAQQQAAAIAAAKATATAAPTTAPTPVATINRPVPTVRPTAVPTVTAAPTVTATAAPTVTTAPTTPPPKTTASATSSAVPPATSGSAAPPEPAVFGLDIAALRKSRPERRHTEFVNMQARWGGLLNDARTNEELKLHAQRLAYLQRIRALGAKDPAFVKSVDALITKEETRDSNALNALRSGGLPTAAAPAAPVAPAAAAPVAPAAAAPAAGATK